jgi:hypothetical protein
VIAAGFSVGYNGCWKDSLLRHRSTLADTTLGAHSHGVQGVILWKMGDAMTEAEWLSCTDPIRMLELLGDHSSRRKMRLFIAEGARSLETLFGNDQKVLAELQEQVAESKATEEDLERFLLRDWPELWEHRAPGGNLPSVWQSARMVVRDRFKLAPLEKNEVVTDGSRVTEYAEMCSQLRCLFGNPFHLVSVEPIWLSWNAGMIPQLAQAIYDNLLFTDISVLADALEEAGCTNADILDHCRGPGPHIRGCWVLDLILGKS